MDKNLAGFIALIIVVAAVTLGAMQYYKLAWLLIVLNVVFLVFARRKNG